jgi:hypothetical protein
VLTGRPPNPTTLCSGSIRSHYESETIHGATAIGTPLSSTKDADGVRLNERIPSFPFEF